MNQQFQEALVAARAKLRAQGEKTRSLFARVKLPMILHENPYLETPVLTPFDRMKYRAELMARFQIPVSWPYSSKSDTRPHH